MANKKVTRGKSKKKKEEEKKKRIRQIIIAIIIIIILLLLTSCTVTNFFGQIGRETKTINTKIDRDTNEVEKVKNKNLYFDVKYDKYLEIGLDSDSYKVGYSIKGINPKKYSCKTSDKSIATCKVQDDYIEIIPKKTGKVTVTLSSNLNDKKYMAVLTAKIVKGNNSSNSNDNTDNSTNKNTNRNTRTTKKESTPISKSNNTKTIPTIKTPVVEKDSDARLLVLKVNDYDLIPEFNKDIFNYMINIDSSVTKVVVNATPNSKNGKIVSGTGTIELKSDTTVVKITVRAKDGNEQDYKVTINKKTAVKDSNNYLDMLVVTGHDIDFNKYTNDYTIDIPYTENKLNISLRAESVKATTNILNNYDFKVGINTVSIVVTAEDNSTRTYKINVNRLPRKLNENSKLQELSIDGYDIDFNQDKYSYVINVDSNTYSIPKSKIHVKTVEDTSSYEILDNDNFQPGENTIKVNVKAENGKTSTYNIIVNKALDTNNKLKSIKIDGKEIKEFNKDVNEYNYTVPFNVDEISLDYVKIDDREQVEITGNTNNLVTGNNVIEIKVISEAGVTNTYKINVEKQEDLSKFYIKSQTTEYEVGYNKEFNNYKDIIIDSNILDNIEDKNIDDENIDFKDGELVISDSDRSSIKIEGTNLKIGLKKTENNQYIVRISYNTDSIGDNTITVTGIRKDREVSNYQIKFNIREEYKIVLDANGGFFSEFSDKYEMFIYKGDKFDLSNYKEAYKLDENDKCNTYKFIGYDTDKDKEDDVEYKVSSLGKIDIDEDTILYAIFSASEKEKYVSSNRIYLVDEDIFMLENGTRGKIYPGLKGSYIMTIKNTTDKEITLKKLIIEEENICKDKNTCLNMGYIVKHTDDTMSGYEYLLGSSTDYAIIHNESGTKKSSRKYYNKKDVNLKDVNLKDIKISAGETKEISLLWKWVDSDNIDTEIGNFVTDDDTYDLTLSYEFEKENDECQE